MSINIPDKITFNAWGKDITVSRNEDWCDISELRKTCSVKDLNKFQSHQSEFLDCIKKEIDEYPIKTEARKTFVHESCLERILRWYELSEEEVIDKFVNPKNRIIGQYKYNKVEILVHLDSKYVNGSKLCLIFRKYIHKWLELKGTKELITYFSKHNKIDVGDVIKKGIGYSNTDIWIPTNLLPTLATWCSHEYALFVSDVMNLFHSDPLKLAAMCIKEYDNQTGQNTVAILHSTKDKDEHNEMLDKIDRLTKENQSIRHENGLLLIDNSSLNKQLSPVKRFLSDFPGFDINDLAKSRSDMLEKCITIKEKEIEEKENIIVELNEQLDTERTEKDNLIRELSVVQGTYDEELQDRDDEIQELNGKRRKKKKSIKITKEVKDELNISKRKNKLYIYTKRENGRIIFAIIPGVLNNFKLFKFIYKGIIIMNKSRNSQEYINEFMLKNKNLYTEFKNYSFILSESVSPHIFEQIFTQYFIKDIISKKDSNDYTVSAIDCIC